MNASDSGDWHNVDPGFHNRLLHSRLAIMFVTIVLGAIAALSVVGFLFNLTINYPGTDRPVIVVDPLWMVGHIVRGVGLAFLTYHLWRYQAAIKHWRSPNGEGTQQFIKTHAAAWNTGAIVLGLLLIYAIIYACVAFGVGVARDPQW